MPRRSKKRSAALSSSTVTVTEGNSGRRRSVNESKQQLCQLLDSRISEHERRRRRNDDHDDVEVKGVSKTVAHGDQHVGSFKDEKLLKSMLFPVLKKFGVTTDVKEETSDDNHNNSNTKGQGSIEPVVYSGEAETKKVTTLRDEADGSGANNGEHPSRRQLRKQNKPQLAYLKASVTHPEVIEWYDCDADYPYLLAAIKSSKNVVGVPRHWQMKREYLSGRSLLSKRPFELPDIIKQTDIEQMRVTLPNQISEDGTTVTAGVDINGREEPKSLKEMSRARVRPKLASLDLDYRKLYDIFFKLGAEWKPDLMLPFGDLYYENRNMLEEGQWKRIVREKKPGVLSQGLREALGLDDGQLPLWCMAMAKAGLPPSYPDLRICCLNWDIKNMKGDVYGDLPSARIGNSGGRHRYFGTLISFEEPDAALEDYLDIPLETQGQDGFEESTTQQQQQQQQELDLTTDSNSLAENVVPIREFVQESSERGVHPTKDTEEDSEEHQLYKVLEEPPTGVQQQVYNNAAEVLGQYNKTGHKRGPAANDKEPEVKRPKHTPTDEETLERFKF